MTTNSDVNAGDLILVTGYGMILQAFVVDYMPRNTSYVVTKNMFHIETRDLIMANNKKDRDTFRSLATTPEFAVIVEAAFRDPKCQVWEVPMVLMSAVRNTVMEKVVPGEIPNSKIADVLGYHDLLKPEVLTSYLKVARERLVRDGAVMNNLIGNYVTWRD